MSKLFAGSVRVKKYFFLRCMAATFLITVLSAYIYFFI